MAELGVDEYLANYKDMSKTGLAFHRKPQTLVDLENERPKNMETIREAMRAAMAALQVRVHDMEVEFYGSRRAEDDLRTMIPHIRNVMKVFQVTYIHASYQVEDIIQYAADPTEVFQADRYDLEFLKDYQRRLVDFVPDRFKPLIEDFRKIYSYVQKYCVSFYEGPGDPDLETAYHYFLKQKEYKEAIKMHLDNITSMATNYRNKVGLNVKHFGLHTNELARRCDCGDLPFVLVFPQAIQNLTMSCQAINTWLKEDQAYVDMIGHDVDKIKLKRDGVAESLRRHKEEHALNDRRIKNLRKEVKDLEQNLEDLKPREKQVKKEIKFLQKQIRNTEIDIELRQQKRKDLEKEAEETGADFSKQCDTIVSDIMQLRAAKPEIQKQVDLINSRAGFLTEKKEDLQMKRTELTEHEKQYNIETTDLVLEEQDLKRLHKCAAKIKDIYNRKTSSEITKKIYHNMPVEPRNARLLPKVQDRVLRKDPLGKASKVVAKKIEREWKDLYRELPFYPPRGERTIDTDLSHILKDKYRGSESTMAKESLEQWRRQNTRANVTELKKTLQKMNRPDIVEEIDDGLRPKRKPGLANRRRWRRVLTKTSIVKQFATLKPPRQSRIARLMSAHVKELQAQKDAEAEEKRRERAALTRKREKEKAKKSRIPALPKILARS